MRQEPVAGVGRGAARRTKPGLGAAWWFTAVIVVLLVAPAVAAVVSLAGRSWSPTNDFAVIDLRVRDVFTANTPLTGLYSRPGWDHPGPLMFWGMAPLSWLSGHATWATRVGGAVLQAIASIWLGIATGRYQRRLLLAAAVVTSLTYLAHNQWLFREPWNLHIPLPYFILFLFLALLAAVGRSRQIIGMSVAGCVLVQTHISYTLLVVAGFGFALGCLGFDAWRARRLPDRWRSTIVISAAVWLVAWSAPIADVVLHWPGNLGRIASYFVRGGHRSVGLDAALHYMADEFRFMPPWLGGPHRYAFVAMASSASLLWLLAPFVLVAVAIAALRASRARDDARMLGLAVVMGVVGIVAISAADEPRAYTFQWRATLAVFFVVACLWCVTGAVGRSASRAVRVVAVVVAVVVVAWGSVTMTVAVVRRPFGVLASREPQLRDVMSSLDRRPHPNETVRVRFTGAVGSNLFDGVVNELDRRNIDVRVDPRYGRVFGDNRTIPRTANVATWYVTERGSVRLGLLNRRRARLLVSTSPLPPTLDRELTQLQQRLARKLTEAHQARAIGFLDTSLAQANLAGIPGLAITDLRRLSQLNAMVEQSGGCQCAIVGIPPDSNPAHASNRRANH